METLRLAEILKDNELQMAQLYLSCRDLFPEQSEAFRLLEQEEKAHASMLAQIVDDINKHPGNWRIGSMSPETGKLVNSRLKELNAELRNPEVSPKYAVTSAISIELSMSERDFGKALVTEDEKFQEMLEVLGSGFAQHYKKLLEIEKGVFKSAKTGF